MQLETRRRKCTWCFEFRKLQISISQGIALIHLLSAKGQRHTGPSEPASCLLSTLTTMEPEPRLQLSSCTHLWSTQQGTARALGRLRKARHQAHTLSGRVRRWQRQGPKPNQGDSWQRGHSETEGFLELHVLEMQVKGGGTPAPQDKGPRACPLGTSKLGAGFTREYNRQAVLPGMNPTPAAPLECANKAQRQPRAPVSCQRRRAWPVP